MHKLLLFTFLLSSTTFLFAQELQLAPDEAHAPFIHGVASGDPLQERVIIWTRVEPDDSTIGTIEVAWEVASDSLFTNIINSGIFPTGVARDWTVKVDVDGLRAGVTYYYRFIVAGNRSRIGRTRTLAADGVAHLRICTFSCSSLYSGYFNAYRRISERDDLDFVVHVGDYVYDFMDSDELIRIPNNAIEYPSNLEEWRALHQLYLLDIDLRAARQQHPWILIWDNHDVVTDTDQFDASVQAFWEYLPIRQPDPNDPSRIYRSFNVGGLVDLTMLDALLYRNKDTLETGGNNLFGTIQNDWLEQQLLESDARWRIMAQQKLASGWTALGSTRDLGSWDGFPAYRKHFYEFLRDNAIQNNVILSGDAHLGLAMDFIGTQIEADFYAPDTGEGSVAVEVLGHSISRGNYDEGGLPSSSAEALTRVHLNENPNHYYADLFRHGYSLLDIRMDSITAEFWVSDILAPSDEETLGGAVVTYYGENHWERTIRYTPTPAKVQINTSIENPTMVPHFSIALYPNPTQDWVTISTTVLPSNHQWQLLRVYNPLGQLVYQSGMYGTIQVDTFDWANGIYVVEVINREGVKQHAKLIRH